ncbi:MAG: hypothetical protein R3F13_04385 [Prosthecobacter sp.]
MKPSLLAFLGLLLMGHADNAVCAVLFSDDFEDGDTLGWTFQGVNTADWSVVNGRLIHNAPSGNAGGPLATGVIAGLSTPEAFRLEADVEVLGSIGGSDWGHVGLIWGLDSPLASPDNFSTAYLRTHWDEVTIWSRVNAVTQAEQKLALPSLTNGVTYHLSVTIDSIQRTALVELDGFSKLISGADFDLASGSMLGSIGLLSASDYVAYDNVVLSSVPEPRSTIILGLLCVLLARRRDR